MSVVYFKILGADAKAVDATSDVTTDPYEFISSHNWAVSINDNAVVGAPTFTVEVSNNITKWYQWDVGSTDVAIEDTPDGTSMTYRYMRVVYLANAASAGTVDIQLSLFNDKKSNR